MNPKNNMKLLSDDILLLRAAEPEDLDCFYRWENDTELWNDGSTFVPYSRFTLRQHIENAGKDLYEARQLRLVIVERVTNQAVGILDLYEFEPHHRRAGVGILIDADKRKNGYAARAIRLLKPYAFIVLGLHQLHALIPMDNVPSQRLFEACGFKQSGVLTHWLKYADGFQNVCVYQLLNP
jgi:diamine N-acetyltransferase